MASWERMDSGQIGPWAVQDGLGIVLARSFFRLAVRDHFFGPLGCLLESFWARSWVPLGSHFLSCWRLFRPKLVSEPSSNRLIFEKVIFHETLRFPIFVFNTKIDPKMGPRSLQDGSKIVLDGSCCLLIFHFDF